MLAIPNSIERFIKETGFEAAVGGPEALGEGREQILAESFILATEAYAAEKRGVDLSDACADFENYPHLVQVHNSVESIWNFPLPEELAAWVQAMWSSQEKPVVREMRHLLVVQAKENSNPMMRALFRFFLFEAVRLNLIAVKRFAPEHYGELGIKDDAISIYAEREVQVWLDTDFPGSREEGAFENLVRSAQLSLGDHIAMHVLPWFRSLSGGYMATMQARGKLEGILSRLDAEHEILLRNSLAAYLEEPAHSIEQLQRRHPMVIGGTKRNTLDKKLERLRTKLGQGQTPAYKGIRPQDILEKVMNDHVLSGEVDDD